VPSSDPVQRFADIIDNIRAVHAGHGCHDIRHERTTSSI
jgi:hypothetical protein